MNETARQAIERSRREGRTVTLDRFTYEDEQALYEACRVFDRGEEGEERGEFTGEGWTVVLSGNGDPR